MDVKYREAFLRDLKKLKRHPLYDRIHDFAFKDLPQAKSLTEFADVKAMSGHRNRFRIRIGSFRVGIRVDRDIVEIMRVLDRRDFYRYFP